jgi:hypothetical protein
VKDPKEKHIYTNTNIYICIYILFMFGEDQGDKGKEKKIT